MKNTASIAAIIAGITLSATIAHADVKNVGGMVCMRYASSEAPKSSEYVTSGGQMCNDSATERLRVTCPLTQDLGNDEKVNVTIDYEMWNLNGLNASWQSHPEERFQCSAYSRTRYADGYYWSGGWSDANDNAGYGATPTAMYATVNKLSDPGFMHAICYIPRKYDNKRSCVSHLRYDEN